MTRAEERDVFFEQLLLKSDRVGRDDYFFLLLDGGLDRRYKISETLAHARSGFDHQVSGPIDRPRDRLGHLDLLGPMFIRGQATRDRAVGSKDRNGVQVCHSRGYRGKRIRARKQ